MREDEVIKTSVEVMSVLLKVEGVLLDDEGRSGEGRKSRGTGTRSYQSKEILIPALLMLIGFAVVARKNVPPWQPSAGREANSPAPDTKQSLESGSSRPRQLVCDKQTSRSCAGRPALQLDLVDQV